MRTYGSVQTKFWSHENIRNLSDQAKLLAVYLLSSSHTNMLGCFRIPQGYVAEDLKWDLEKVQKSFDELSAAGFLVYDKSNNCVFICNFLKYHPVENPNQGKSIAKLFDEIPKSLVFLPQLINQLFIYQKQFSEEFCGCLETLSKPFRNQEQKQEQKQELLTSGKPDSNSPCGSDFEKKLVSQTRESSSQLQAIEVLDFLNEKTRRNYRPVDANLKLIIARLKSGASVDDCRQVIAKKTREWKADSKMVEYLRPATLFNAIKFEQYLGELVDPDERPAFHESK